MNESKLHISLPEGIENLTDSQRDRFKEKILDIMEESFIHSADEDYLSARILILNKMTRMFYWAASQTIEKYFKAILLQQGVSVKNYSHKLLTMINENPSVFIFLGEVNVTKPEEFTKQFGNNLESLWPFKSISQFIEHIEEVGSADSRYNQVQLDYVLSVLILFDRLISKIQSHIVRFDTIEQHINFVNPILKKYLKEQNDCYGNLNVIGSTVAHNQVTTLKLVLNNGFGYQSQYENWVSDNLKIHPKTIENLKNK
jgi:hypothetical protein